MVSEIRGGASYRLRDVVDSLDFNELVKMQQDLASGGFHLRKFLDKVISEKKNLHADHCATCSAPLTPTSRHNFTLVFGPDDFRKKARSEEHTSELQSQFHLVCRLLLEKKNK